MKRKKEEKRDSDRWKWKKIRRKSSHLALPILEFVEAVSTLKSINIVFLGLPKKSELKECKKNLVAFICLHVLPVTGNH